MSLGQVVAGGTTNDLSRKAARCSTHALLPYGYRSKVASTREKVTVARAEDVIPIVVNLTRAQAAVLSSAAVVVTSALDCGEANAAMQGLLVFRQAVARAGCDRKGQACR
jgi:hypothetical protein